MRKRPLLLTVGLLNLLAFSVACGSGGSHAANDSTAPDTAPTSETVAETVTTETEAETVYIETKAETESPNLIPDPTRIDLSSFNEELFRISFLRGNSAYLELSENGAKFIGRSESRDPCVQWQVSSMYKAAGYPLSPDGESYVPFTPEEKRVIVFKIQAEWGGAFEMFYATEDRHYAQPDYAMTEIYGGDSEFFGERVSRYIIFEADESTKGWSTRFNDTFRLDYTNFVQKDDVFLLEKIAFCTDRAEAEAFIAADRGELPPAPAVEAGYYVCLYEDRLHISKDNVKGRVLTSLEEAKERCDKYKQYGYRVANETGEVVYAPYTPLQCDLLREGNYITEYAREMKFKYGDSCTNPGINHRPLRTSCDRLVDWILYRAGYTDQPLVQGKVVSNLVGWCEDMGFEKITRLDELQAGDIIFVRADRNGIPEHVFMLASDYMGDKSLRYDHGSDTRIMSRQPSTEPVDKEDAPFLFAYRPVATEENNIHYNDRYAD